MKFMLGACPIVLIRGMDRDSREIQREGWREGKERERKRVGEREGWKERVERGTQREGQREGWRERDGERDRERKQRNKIITLKSLCAYRDKTIRKPTLHVIDVCECVCVRACE